MTPRAALRAALREMTTALRAQLAEATISLPPTEDYAVVRADLVNRLGDAFLGYVSTTRGAADKNEARRAVTADVPAAFYRGLRDAGAEEVEGDDAAWMAKKQAEQLAYLNNAFDDLKVMRKAETATESGLRARAEMWGQTLDAIYGEGKLRATKSKLLTWVYGDTDHCSTCQKLNGQTHRASWFLKRDYIPGKPGAAMDCGGYRCQCKLVDKNGDEVTI